MAPPDRQLSSDAPASSGEDLDPLITRAFAALPDLAVVREVVDSLAAHAGPRARFAACLLSLELARKGEERARSELSSLVAVLLEAWRDPDLAFELCGGHDGLKKSFRAVAPLLAEFETSRRGAPAEEETVAETQEMTAVPNEPVAETIETLIVSSEPVAGPPLAPSAPGAQPLEPLLDACFASLASAERLEQAIGALLSQESERALFAQCLLFLELAKLGVKSAQLEFTRRTPSLLAAGSDPAVADALIGENSGLRAMWDALLPDLEEFFEGLRQTAEEEDDDDGEIALDGAELEEQELEADAFEPAESEEEIVDFEDQTPRAVPPPFSKKSTGERPVPGAPPPFRRPSTREVGAPVRKSTAWKAVFTPAPPPPSNDENADDLLPSTVAFWTYAQEFLGKLPDESGAMSGKVSFPTQKKSDQARLEKFAKELLTRFPASPQAHALCSLTLLLVGTQMKERTLFGSPNQERAAALTLGLSQLGSPRAAGQAAVLFETDGRRTAESFGKVVELMSGYLQFCLRNKLDPRSALAAKKFTSR